MDKLTSEQDRLCSWLSADPDYILHQCGDILSVNEWKEVLKQTIASEKIKVLLKMIINKGDVSCHSFFDILKQHQAHYPLLQQLFSPHTQASPTPTAVADNSSVVTAREITNTTAKSLSLSIETVRGPGSRPSDVVPRADYTALDGSVICADKISGVTVDGDINISVCVKPSQVQAGTVDDTPPSSQGPAEKMIKKHKVELIDCLRTDPFILQHVHAQLIVPDRQYENLKHLRQPQQSIIDLIDLVIGKGEETCVQFLQLLKEPDVLGTYPQLKLILNTDAEH